MLQATQNDTLQQWVRLMLAERDGVDWREIKRYDDQPIERMNKTQLIKAVNDLKDPSL